MITNYCGGELGINPSNQERLFQNRLRSFTGLQSKEIQKAIQEHDGGWMHRKDYEPFCTICSFRRELNVT